MSQPPPSTLADLARSLERWGLDRLYLNAETHSLLERQQEPAMPKPKQSAAEQPFVKKPRVPDEKVVARKKKLLAQLAEPLKTCEACKLHGGRTNLVYGVGNPDADLLFVGEGPGYDEDMKGEPFVGRAGRLLTDMIEKGMRLRRDQVYIANIVKCRPPENRNPNPDEMETCLPNLLAQIEIVEPKVMVTLGAVPARGFLGQKLGITKLRGTWLSFEGIPVLPTLHPAYLLRNPPAKKDCWEDLKQVIAFLNGDLKPPASSD